MAVRTVTLSTGDTTATLVAGQTSPLTDDAGDILYDDPFVEWFVDGFAQALTITHPAVHKTTVEVT